MPEREELVLEFGDRMLCKKDLEHKLCEPDVLLEPMTAPLKQPEQKIGVSYEKNGLIQKNREKL